MERNALLGELLPDAYAKRKAAPPMRHIPFMSVAIIRLVLR